MANRDNHDKAMLKALQDIAKEIKRMNGKTEFEMRLDKSNEFSMFMLSKENILLHTLDDFFEKNEEWLKGDTEFVLTRNQIKQFLSLKTQNLIKPD